MEIRIIQGQSMQELTGLLSGEKEVFIVYDENVAQFVPSGESVKGMIAIDTSEELKTMDTVLGICRQLLEMGASRGALVLAVGGGITTDITGFAASIYKRGIRYANAPTTLLSQVDAAIGGKTGVNLDNYKNMLGVIVQPQFTFICPEPLKTLPERELKAGLSEMLKTFLLADGDLYEKAVLSVKNATDGDLIMAAARIKAAIVQRDPFEKGERTKLNLGHTFAHAIEHEAQKKGDDISHGEAVAIGIIMAAALAERLNIAENGLAEHLAADFRSIGLPTECPYSEEMLREAMAKDKKAAGGKVKFVLPITPGEVRIEELSVEEAFGK